MTPQPGEALPLSDEEEAALRRFAARYGDGSFGGDIKRLLATLDREREHAQTCLMCQRADDINARAALAANQPVAEERTCRCGHAERTHEARGCLSCRCQRFRPAPSVPGLPSSFPVGSVSGSPHGAHAYNVEPLEEE